MIMMVMAFPSEASVLVRAASWVEQILTGSLAAGLAIIAVATIGLMMLRGHIEVRRSGSTILGCFLVFGAGSVAAGIMELAKQEKGVGRSDPQYALQEDMKPKARLDPAIPHDPYAGASVNW